VPLALQGVDKTLKALKHLSPDIYKEMNAEIKIELKKLAYQAKAEVPSTIAGLSNFTDSGKIKKSATSSARAFPVYNPQQVKAGIGYSTARQRPLQNGWVAIYSLFNRSAAGAIAEWAGRVSGPQGSSKSRSNNPKAGEHFIAALNAGIGNLERVGTGQNTRGRIAYPVVKKDEGKIRLVIIDAINRAVAKYERSI